MPIPLPKPRHTVEKFDDLVRVTLPGRRKFLDILFMCVWFVMWGYIVSGLIYFVVSINKAMELERQSNPAFQGGEGFIIFSLIFLFFFLVLLGFGAFGVYRFLWMLAGKEVIEANSKLLRVTRQLFSWKREKEYFADEVKDLRVTLIQHGFSSSRSIRKPFISNDMITFDYGAKTLRFGSEIEEAEAKQIILAIKDGLPQSNTD